MAYEPTVWVDDETPVNAENLNKLEQGVAEIHTAKENGELDGTPGKSAYQYALDGGYTGTEEEFARKLASESTSIHIGSEPPEDENVTVWIDTDEEPESSGADWNASEGEPGHVLNRTHYENGTEMKTLFDQTITVANNAWQGSGIVNLVDGNTYTVVWDGTTYECVAFATVFNGANAIALGNPYLMGVGENNNQPFVFGWAYEYRMLASGSMTNGDHTIKITEEVKAYKKLDECYLPYSARSYVIKLLKSDTTSLTGSIEISRISYDEFADIIWNGGTVLLDVTDIYGGAVSSRFPALGVNYVDEAMSLSFMIIGGDLFSIAFTNGTWTPPTT